MVNTFDTSIITVKKYSSRRGLNSPYFTSPRFIKSSWTSSSDGYSVFSDNDDRDDYIQGLDVKNSCVEFLWRRLLSDYYRGVGSPLPSTKIIDQNGKMV